MGWKLICMLPSKKGEGFFIIIDLYVVDSPLVVMMPRAMKALRLTSLLLCAMSLQRGSKAPRPSRATLFSSPDNRGSQ